MNNDITRQLASSEFKDAFEVLTKEVKDALDGLREWEIHAGQKSRYEEAEEARDRKNGLYAAFEVIKRTVAGRPQASAELTPEQKVAEIRRIAGADQIAIGLEIDGQIICNGDLFSAHVKGYSGFDRVDFEALREGFEKTEVVPLSLHWTGRGYAIKCSWEEGPYERAFMYRWGAVLSKAIAIERDLAWYYSDPTSTNSQQAEPVRKTREQHISDAAKVPKIPDPIYSDSVSMSATMGEVKPEPARSDDELIRSIKGLVASEWGTEASGDWMRAWELLDSLQAAPAAEPAKFRHWSDALADDLLASGDMPSQPPSGELPPAGVMQPVPELVWPATCDGKEQEAFEAWAVSQKHDMSRHPLHYLFLNNETYAARQAWKAGMLYAVEQMRAAIASKQAAIPPEFDVRTILMDVVPGDDGMSREVYAKNVGEVVDKLTELAERVEELSSKQAALVPAAKFDQMRGRPVLLDGAPLLAEGQLLYAANNIKD